jgi:hypothetical protein
MRQPTVEAKPLLVGKVRVLAVGGVGWQQVEWADL